MMKKSEEQMMLKTNLYSSLDSDRGSQIPVRQQNEWHQNGRGELDQISIPDNVMRIQPEVGN